MPISRRWQRDLDAAATPEESARDAAWMRTQLRELAERIAAAKAAKADDAPPPICEACGRVRGTWLTCGVCRSHWIGA